MVRAAHAPCTIATEAVADEVDVGVVVVRRPMALGIV